MFLNRYRHVWMRPNNTNTYIYIYIYIYIAVAIEDAYTFSYKKPVYKKLGLEGVKHKETSRAKCRSLRNFTAPSRKIYSFKKWKKCLALQLTDLHRLL